MDTLTPAVVQTEDGSPPLVVLITGPLDAVAAAELETTMVGIREEPRDVVFDVSNTDRLQVDGLLVLAEHAQWLRSRSCTARLRGAPPAAEQLARLLGYERLFGLT